MGITGRLVRFQVGIVAIQGVCLVIPVHRHRNRISDERTKHGILHTIVHFKYLRHARR